MRRRRSPLRGALCSLAALAVWAGSEAGCATAGSDPVDSDADVAPDATWPRPDAQTGGPDADASVRDQNAPDAPPARACSYDNWCPQPLPLDPVNPKKYDLRGVWVAPTHQAFAVSATGEVLRWDGTAWTELYAGPEPLRQIWGASADDLWLLGDTRLLRARNVGGAWTVRTVPTPGNTVGIVWGASPTEVWIGGLSGTYRWNGEDADGAWTQATLPRNLPGAFGGGFILSMWGSGPDDFWARGVQWAEDCLDCGGPTTALLLRWDPTGVDHAADGGADAAPDAESDAAPDAAAERPGRWRIVPTGLEANVDVYQFSPSSSAGGEAQLLCLGTRCTRVLRGTPSPGERNALTFTIESTSFQSNSVPAIWGSRANDVWLAGSNGQVRHYDGSTWAVARITNTDLPIGRALRAVHGVVDGAQSDVWIVGNNVALHHTGAP